MFLLFAGEVYYPHGGAGDLKGEFAAIELAITEHDNNIRPEHAEDYNWWAEVFDVETMKVVAGYSNGSWKL